MFATRIVKDSWKSDGDGSGHSRTEDQLTGLTGKSFYLTTLARGSSDLENPCPCLVPCHVVNVVNVAARRGREGLLRIGSIAGRGRNQPYLVLPGGKQSNSN